jgi:ectoine hydroxylase-related dioxygenase (phytanoyl-CoA dioxygenase family)
VRNFTKLQGVLALSSTGPETGGFEAVCGFHNHIEQWCKDNKEGTYLKECQDLLKHMYQIYQRAGSVLIFSRELPHGINSNTSESNVRYAQYLRMAPESSLMLTPS